MDKKVQLKSIYWIFNTFQLVFVYDEMISLLNMSCHNAISIDDAGIQFIQDIHHGKKWKYLIFRFNENNTNIIIDKIGDSKEGFETFLDNLPETDVAYGIYNYGFDVNDGTHRHRQCFITWVPNKSNRIRKFVAANSKHAVKCHFGGLLVDFMISHKDEMNEQILYQKCITTIK